jgi:hypothetical protein
VTRLILLGGYLRGRLKRPNPEQKKLYEMLTTMIRDGWGSSNPVIRHFFTSNFIPDALPEVGASFDELQHIATSPATALRIWRMNAEIDATDLARRVKVPTLVLHCQGDRVAPLEEGHLMARLIPGANFVKEVEALKSKDPKAVMAKMKEMPSEDPLFGKGKIRIDGRHIHDMYLVEVKKPEESKGAWDYYKTLATIPADQALRPLDQGGCPLVK